MTQYLDSLKSRFDTFDVLREGIAFELDTLRHAYEQLGPKAICKRLMVHPALIGAALCFTPNAEWPDIGIDPKLEHPESWYVTASIYEDLPYSPDNKYKTKCVYSPGVD